MDTGCPEKGATKENTRFSSFGTPIRSAALGETVARLLNLFLQSTRYFQRGGAWPLRKKTGKSTPPRYSRGRSKGTQNPVRLSIAHFPGKVYNLFDEASENFLRAGNLCIFMVKSKQRLTRAYRPWYQAQREKVFRFSAQKGRSRW